jgi:RNA-directed DNA polymerase
MAKGGSKLAVAGLEGQESPVNTGAPLPDLDEAWWRVLEIQTKLHRWASDDAGRRFDDLFNLVTDPATLLVAWERVRTNRGARTAGVDGSTAYYIRKVAWWDVFLAELRADLKSGRFAPLPVRERMIPKAGGRLRRLGIPTVRDRVAQAALKLVLEPIFEADFQPCSYVWVPDNSVHLMRPARTHGSTRRVDLVARSSRMAPGQLARRAQAAVPAPTRGADGGR